jgi:hypothetical protein
MNIHGTIKVIPGIGAPVTQKQKYEEKYDCGIKTSA